MPPNPRQLPGEGVAWRSHTPGRTLVGVVLAALLALAGCGGGEATPGGVGPIKPPEGFVKLTGAGFTIAAPDTFSPQSQRSTNGEPKLTLNARPPRPGDLPTLVAVIRDVRPQLSVLEQLKLLEEVKREVQARDVFREEVRWPGARQAFVVGWTQDPAEPPAAPDPPSRNLQLAVQVTDTLIINVVATAPAETFDDTQVTTVLRTFRLTRGR